MWYQHNDRHIDQCTRIESPKINPHIYGQLIFNKNSFTTNGFGTTVYQFAWVRLNFSILSVQKLIQNRSDLNIVTKTIKVLEDYIGVNFCNVALESGS